MEQMCMREAIAACLGSHEKLLVCCAGEDARLVQEKAAELGIQTVSWEPDLRWQNLARLAILNRARAAVGSAATMLALSKLGKATAAPMPIRDVILIGLPCPEWMKASIASGMDARVWDCCGSGEETEDPALEMLGQELLRWSSVLDYRVERTQMGLSLELIVFPGKRLPRLPSGAKVTVREWRAGKDIPFFLEKP